MPRIHGMNGKAVLGTVTAESTTLPGEEVEAQTLGVEKWHEMRIGVIISTVVDNISCLLIFHLKFPMALVDGSLLFFLSFLEGRDGVIFAECMIIATTDS